jgi:hypothetical protein
MSLSYEKVSGVFPLGCVRYSGNRNKLRSFFFSLKGTYGIPVIPKGNVYWNLLSLLGFENEQSISFFECAEKIYVINGFLFAEDHN